MLIFKKGAYKWYFVIPLLVWVISFPVAEGFFRLLGDRPSSDLSGLYVPFGDGAYKLGPSVDTEASWAAGRFTVHTDALGLRCDGARQFAVKAGDKVDVLFLGDSQGFGHGVDFGESLTGNVAEMAKEDGVRLANASVGGHSALNQFELARWLREKQGLTVSNYVLLVTPLMARYGDGYTHSTVGKDGRLYEDSNDRMAYVRLWLRTHFVLYDRLRDAARNSGIGSRPKNDMPSVFRLFGAGETEDLSRRHFVSFLRQLKSFTDGQGAGLRLVYVPLTVEADFETVRNGAGKAGIALDPNLPARICFSAAAELGIPAQDLRPVMKQLHDQGDPLRLKGDFHYDQALSRACAASIWNNLEIFLKRATHGNEQSIKTAYGH